MKRLTDTGSIIIEQSAGWVEKAFVAAFVIIPLAVLFG